jgi:tetratricopeptide (TPR) repeat protein
MDVQCTPRYTKGEDAASVYKRSDQSRLLMLSLEKVIELEPNDIDILFDTAYAFAEERYKALSLLHYRALLSLHPEHAGALNNVGVLFQQMSLPIRAVASYQRASELNNTLASANLAYLLMNAGFMNEAQTILDEARLSSDVHPNVGSAISAVSEKDQKEEETREKILEAGLRQQQFLRTCADAYFDPQSIHNFDGIWVWPSGEEVISTQTNGKVLMIWRVQDKEHKITGQTSGSAAIISYETHEPYSIAKVRSGFAIATDLAVEIMLYETDNSASFLRLERKPPAL